jgi:hypothetical protein
MQVTYQTAKSVVSEIIQLNGTVVNAEHAVSTESVNTGMSLSSPIKSIPVVVYVTFLNANPTLLFNQQLRVLVPVSIQVYCRTGCAFVKDCIELVLSVTFIF